MKAHAESIADESDISSLWEFHGEFTSYEMPAPLSTFMKWVLLGPHMMNLGEETETYEVNNIIKAFSQFASENINTARQTNYQLQKGQPMRAVLEMPLNT